jgi:hypothetical protein
LTSGSGPPPWLDRRALTFAGLAAAGAAATAPAPSVPASAAAVVVRPMNPRRVSAPAGSPSITSVVFSTCAPVRSDVSRRSYFQVGARTSDRRSEPRRHVG